MKPEDEFIHGIVMVALGVATLTLMILITPYVLLIGGAGTLGYAWYHSPKRNERVAREHTLALYEATLRVAKPIDLDYLIDHHTPRGWPESIRQQLRPILYQLLAEDVVSSTVPEPPVICNSVEGARYRDQLAKIGQQGRGSGQAEEAVAIALEAVRVFGEFFPYEEGEVFADINYCIEHPHQVVQDIILAFYDESNYRPFKRLKEQLDRNYHELRQQMPTEYKHGDVVERYLKGTPLLALFTLKVPFAIPEALRFEHTHIVAGTGHGKTQTIQYHIAKDIPELLEGRRSVVVIDSQRDLIQNLLQLDIPKERVVYIDPEDIEHPVALNLFAVGQERFTEYSTLEREQLQNSIIELYEFVLSSIMDTALTGQQSIIFRYVTRLMLEIPGATLYTFLDILEGGNYDRYIEKLQGVSRKFFENQFNNPEFRRMREAVTRRMYLILDNQSFDRMFNNAESRLDLFSEMNEGKLIIINTSKATLKEAGTRTFGRFFVALIAQAASERALIEHYERTPTIVYLDEAHEYLDRNVNIILSQARKQRIGMVMAHQYLNQLSNDLRAGLEANTSIKMAGGVSASDARTLATQMGTTSELVQNVPKLTFATWAKGVTQRAIPVSFPVGELESLPRRYDLDQLITYQRQRYSVPKQTEGEGFTMHEPDPEDEW